MPSINNVGDALLQLVQEVFLFIPRLVGAALWLLVGYFVAKAVQAVLTRALRALRFDQVMDRAGVGRALQAAGTQLDPAGLLGLLVFWWIFLMLGINNAVEALGMTQVTVFINGILGYLPNVFAAILIVIVGALLANVLAGVARGAATEAGLSTAGIIGSITRWGVLLFAVMTALTQLNIGQGMILILFGGLVLMLSIAGGLAFGLGGVDSARSLLAGQTMTNILQPGQQVQIGQQSGTVVRHDLNTTVLNTDQGQVSIPNATLAREQVTVLNGRG